MTCENCEDVAEPGEELCRECGINAAERAHESFLADFYGGSGPVTDQERWVHEHQEKQRGNR